MLAFKLLLLAVVVGCIGYAAISIFPRKLVPARKLGLQTTNADLIAAAKGGDAEAMVYIANLGPCFWVLLPSAIGLSLLHSLTKDAKGK